ncbi:hypothetical protein SAMN04487996_12849 [Dyadobacter soli]|uniref:Uncharacterized protein n=1 Tax=Dyadobacter soli TaxID=659014 RepID=A0A1G7ZJS1_9BACT|nr:hypothetical protein [Dyadobacter soli]SDH08817.1 hypothetical protein SAMN04487996_12849 [Dyadobacter soli]
MNTDYYLLTRDENLSAYYFVSEGSKGRIQKGVFFQLVNEEEQLYNLAFGDWNDDTGFLDDMVRTDNRDIQKVLNTVAIAVVDFMNENSNAKLIARGSTMPRTRLYRMNIARNLNEITEQFLVQGIKDGRLEVFREDVNYEAFLLTKRFLTL